MSTHRSLMAPKRGSTRFTVTREDCQLDPRKRELPASINVTPIPCGSGGRKKYRLALENSTDRICNLEALEDELRTIGLNLRVSAVENILNTLLDVIPKFMAQTGQSVRIGNLLTLKAYVTGSLDNANDALDPDKNHLEIRATISPALRYSISKAKLVNVKQLRNAISNVSLEMNGAVSDEVDAEHNIVVFGDGIYVSPQSATDENARGRVWIETLDGKMLGRCTVLRSSLKLTVVRFMPDAPVGDGDVRLVVETYGTKKAADAGDKSSLARYSRVVRYRGATRTAAVAVA